MLHSNCIMYIQPVKVSVRILHCVSTKILHSDIYNYNVIFSVNLRILGSYDKCYILLSTCMYKFKIL